MVQHHPGAGRRPLDQRRVDIWYVVLTDVADPALRRAYIDVMAADERAQYGRFLVSSAAEQYLVARALVRSVLSHYHPLAPSAWRFVRSEHGRPYVDPALDASLTFNLSHTDGLVACAVARNRAVGLDVERVDRQADGLDIATHYFAPAEVDALRALPPDVRRAQFLEYWTLKESYVKACDVGLSLPLDSFAFHLEADQPIRIAFDTRVADDAVTWQFALFRPTPQHVMALSTRRGGESPIDIDLLRTVPLDH